MEGKTLKKKLANYPAVNLILANGTEYPEKEKFKRVQDRLIWNVSLRKLFAILI
jgi:hypothetical protein